MAESKKKRHVVILRNTKKEEDGFEETKSELNNALAGAKVELKNWWTKQDEKYKLKLNQARSEVYHYTNAAGLKGIVELNKLWMGNAAYCNDASEFTYGLDLFKAAAKEYYDEKLDPSSKAILLLLRARLDSKTSAESYVFSLTVQGDQLSQWRGYAHQGCGYSIGFDFEELREIDPSVKCDWVTYTKMVHRAACSKIVKLYTKRFTDVLNRNPGKRTVEYIVDRIEEEIDFTIPFFKHSGFREEREFRMVISPKYAKMPSGIEFKVELRESNHLLVPYIEVGPTADGAHLPIKVVYIGPKLDYEKAAQSIRILLKNAGYTDDELEAIDIKHSKVPFV